MGDGEEEERKEGRKDGTERERRQRSPPLVLLLLSLSLSPVMACVRACVLGVCWVLGWDGTCTVHMACPPPPRPPLQRASCLMQDAGKEREGNEVWPLCEVSPRSSFPSWRVVPSCPSHPPTVHAH